jgi:hypothetical protein
VCESERGSESDGLRRGGESDGLRRGGVSDGLRRGGESDGLRWGGESDGLRRGGESERSGESEETSGAKAEETNDSGGWAKSLEEGRTRYKVQGTRYKVGWQEKRWCARTHTKFRRAKITPLFVFLLLCQRLRQHKASEHHYPFLLL